MRKYIFIVAVLAFTITVSVTAQNTKDYKSTPYWIEMMQDPSANFFETQKAFNTYWKGREITRGCGWKPFKRWEWFWAQRVDSKGHLPAADKNWKEYFKYKSSHEKSSNGNWINLGPIEQPGNNGTGQPNGNGRINSLAFHPTDGNTFYVGAPAGGLWKTTDGGESWTSNTDDLPTLGVSSILIDYDNTDIMYLGTGDRDASDSQGVGVLKSINGGDTWELFNNGMDNATVGRMIMDPDNSEVIIAATSSGIYKTTDGAVNWELKQDGNFKDIDFHTSNKNIIYAIKGGYFYRSNDLGETWTYISNGLPSGSRGSVAVTPANPDYVYIVLTQSSVFKGLYFSDNAGLSFTEQSTTPNIMDYSCNGTGNSGQGWYDLDIAADPNNGSVIYVGGVNIFKSSDKGKTWNINAHWTGDCGVPAVHADQHVLMFNPLNDVFYSGNDGGIYWTDNGGSDWTEITSGIAIAQVYKLGQSATVKNYVINGYQDNGTAVYEETGWATVMGGDGMDCLIDYSDETYSYGEYYYGAIVRFHNNYYDGGITDGISEQGGWVTPFVLHETNPNTMFVGMKNVWRTNNVKESYTSSIDWLQISDGIGSGNISVLENSSVNADILYVGKGNNLYRTDNANADSPSWLNISTSVPGSGNIKDVESHPYNENSVYCVKGSHVYKSINKGLNWEDITGSLPDVTINTIEYYKNSQEGLYIGTDLGCFYRESEMDDWIEFGDGLPATATVTDIEFYYDSETPANDRIRASTYGRGLWDSDLFFTTPTASFEANVTEIPTDCSINFTDKSSGVPHYWAWNFEGAEPSTSNLKNPIGITYHTEGEFSVTLTVSNAIGENTVTETSYITVSGSMLPEADFSADKTAFCIDENAIAHFTDETANCPAEWQWVFEPTTVEFLEGTTSESQNPVVKFLSAESYDVTLISTNSAGNNTITKENFIAVGGKAIPFDENFTDGLAFNAWEVINTDNNKTWEEYDINGNNTIRLNCYAYLVPPGQRDQLISPTLDFSNNEEVFLHFDYAYARHYASITDSLIVKISSDCGTTWSRIYQNGEDGTGVFATHELTEDDFIPTTPEDWCGSGWGSDCPNINLSDYAGMNNIKIMFESYNFYGNNIYLDNILINNSIATDITQVKETEMTIVVYPNPSDGNINIIGKNINESFAVIISSPSGEIIINESVAANSSTFEKSFDLNYLPKGIYFIRILGNTFKQTKKIVIQ
ncbi:MAG: PKD domain-containing protein [Bacteroidota bacterium]|nr:PKD domain-containing protein [Bacteroidota bacterium]